MPYSIVHKAKAEQADVLAIAAPLQQFNLDNGPKPDYRTVVLTIEDETDAPIKGGLFGKAAYGWLHIEFLIVPPDARGHGLGSSLMQQAEAIACEHNCVGVRLETMSFQALPFYEKLGYTIFGELDSGPSGATLYFLRKRL